MKKTLSAFLILVIVGVVLTVFAVTFHFSYRFLKSVGDTLSQPFEFYVTTSLDDYGRITGNHNNQRPEEFINSFFPTEIEAYFSDVQYHYRGQNIDTSACETYLEFTIDDPIRFNEHYESLMQFGASQPAYFNERYELWFVGNRFDLVDCSNVKHEKVAGEYNISTARLGMVLCDREQKRFVYSAIYVYDGGYADTKELGYFFGKFGIDPKEFMIEYALCPDSLIPDCQH